MCIIIVFWVGTDKLFSCFFSGFLQSLPRDQSRDVTLSLGEAGWFFIVRLLKFILFFVNWIHYAFPSIINITCYVYYYCIWLSFNSLFFCFFAGFFLFSPKGSVTGCDFSLSSFCYSKVYFISRRASSFRLLLLRLWSNRCGEALVVYEILFWIGLLSQEVRQRRKKENNNNNIKRNMLGDQCPPPPGY